MPPRRAKEPEGKPSRQRAASTPAARENQLVAKAVNLAEKQLENGTASAQVISHYLKMGSSREQLEQQRLRHENDLLQVKREAIESQQRMEEIYKQALTAMKSYQGESPEEDSDEEYED
jgi:hypothetical protein